MAQRGGPGKLGTGKLITAFATALLLSSGAALACELGDGGSEISGGGVTVSYRPVDGAIASGAFFELDVAVCTADGAPGTLTAVDATMPAHGHGMNYKPVVTETAPGRYRVEGLMFHMTGSWQFRFDAEADGKAVTLTVDRMVEK